MSIEKIFSINPYDERELELVEEYEDNNMHNKKISDEMKSIRKKMQKEQYLESKKSSNEINEDLFIEKDSKIIGHCHLNGEKDIKSCKINFILEENSIKLKKLISLITTYVIDVYGMQEVFTTVKKENKEMINALSVYGYENLGEENNEILFLKEQEYYEKLQRAIG